MKRLFLIAGLMAAFMLVIVAVSAAGANFAGTWVLDKAKSKDLSTRMAGFDKVTWVITQDDKTIGIEQKTEGGQAPPAGGGGGGTGGGGGPRPPAGPTTYNLDGKEVTGDQTMGQMTAKVTSKATWAANDLELMRKTAFTGPDGAERVTTNTQKLSLSADGKVLTAVTHSESQRGPQDSTLVFNKQ